MGEFNTIHLIAEIISVLAISLIVYSSIKKVGRKTLLVFNIIINLMNATHYLLMQAYSGTACCLIFCAMLAVFYFKGATKFLSSLVVPALFMVAFVVFGLLTYQNWISLFPIVGHSLLVIAFWMDREIVIKEFCVGIALMWVAYNGLIHSYVNFFGQIGCFISYLIFVIRYYVKKKKAAENTENAEI